MKIKANNHQDLASLVTCFLQLNDSPSDAQVHSLAHSLAIDVEELEALVYRMLGQCVDQSPVQTIARRVLASLINDVADELSTDQKVLIDEYDPNTSSDDEVILNDSVRAPDDMYNLQEYLTNDGELVDEVEVNVQDLLTNDGERINSI